MKLASTASTCLSVTKAESVYSGRVCCYGEVILTGGPLTDAVFRSGAGVLSAVMVGL